MQITSTEGLVRVLQNVIPERLQTLAEDSELSLSQRQAIQKIVDAHRAHHRLLRQQQAHEVTNERYTQQLVRLRASAESMALLKIGKAKKVLAAEILQTEKRLEELENTQSKLRLEPARKALLLAWQGLE